MASRAQPGSTVLRESPRRWALVFTIPAALVGSLFLFGMFVGHDELAELPTARVRRGDVAITIDEPGLVTAASGRVDTQIGAADRARVRPESRARIHLDSLPGVVIEGRVEAVSDVAREKRSHLTGLPTGIEVFDVRVAPVESDPRLREGLAAAVEILVSEHPAALYVPVSGIFLDGEDRPTVYVRSGRWAEARPVELLASDDRVAVLGAGVQEGDEILVALPPVN